MSAVGAGEVLKPILLRSSTPAPNEKVLNYLEGMSREGDEVDNTPPRSMIDPHERRTKSGSVVTGPLSPRLLHSPVPQSRNGDHREGRDSHLGHGSRNGGRSPPEHDDDIDSNVQEGRRSEDGETVLPVREPGPHDPPGPKYESYDSVQTWGNRGPLPPDDHYGNAPWNPDWSHNHGKALMSLPWSQNGAHQTPNGSAKPPLPTSDFGGSPLQKAHTALSEQRRQTPPEEPASPRTASRAQSRATPPEDSRPLSPLSARSRVTSKTRASEKGTAYPPLPESRDGETNYDAPMSPKSQSQFRNKAASISPSDSPSQVKPYQPSQPRGGYENGAEFSPRSGGWPTIPQNAAVGRSLPGSVMSGSHQSRPFSPYRHAATTADLLHAAVRGRAMAIPEEDERHTSEVSQGPKAPSAKSSHHSKAPTIQTNAKAPSQVSVGKQSSAAMSKHTQRPNGGGTPRPPSPMDLNAEEVRIVNDALAAHTPRTSYYAASALDPDTAGHYHDTELCVLLHQENDPSVHEFVKKALRKAIRQRVKRLGMKYDNESIREFKKTYHDHDPSVHMRPDYSQDEPPQWAADIKRELVLMQQRIESLGPKIENLKSPQNPNPNRSFGGEGSRMNYGYEGDDYTQTPVTQTVNIHTQPNGTLADSMYQPAETEIVEDQDYDEVTETPHQIPRTDGETHTQNRSNYAMSDTRDDSPGQQFLEEELYKLRQKPQGSQSARSHHTWEVARENEDFDDDADHGAGVSGLPTIPDTNGGGYPDREQTTSPPLPALPDDASNRELVPTPQPNWQGGDFSREGQQQLPPWQRIHQRLLSWAIIWPSSELDQALNSTTRGQQVDEVALSIWSTQTYKRYVRARLTDTPQGVVDRLFVPPNMADAISTAVFNGRHGDACGMLRDLWSPFGLAGMPRLLVVLAKHRSDENHWVVHRFSLPDGGLTTYDSYPERTLPDGRPLGWWFAIRFAWPDAIYPNPDHLVQKMVRLHRPMQLPIDNSVAAAGIWRNILMGSRAERSLDLERLRDLINTEVKNLRQRKQLGKLSIGAPRPAWEDMN